ncbi:MAG: hypothetical protein R3A52_06705 [Polyangiales bacterium]
MSGWPEWLSPVQEGNVRDAAVAVLSPDAQHVGVAWRDAGGTLSLLHLAFHYDLRNDTPPSKRYYAVSPSLEPERLAQVAAMCERVLKRQRRGIPYGFRYDATAFSRDGRLVLGNEERGLTCATFVLALYRSVGVELLRVAEWPDDRPDDEARWTALLEVLRSGCPDAEHVSAVAREVRSRRFRPEEVAGGSSRPAPSPFVQAVAAANELVAALDGVR